MKNPLRYPGAKSKLFDYIKDLINNENLNDHTFIEPYGGSAALTFLLLENNTIENAKINERDPLIYSFWYSVFNRTEELIQKIQTTPITLENWYFYSQFKNPDFCLNMDILEIGFACLFLNRTSFSGILKGGPLGGHQQTSAYTIDCRFNKDSIIKSILFCACFANRIELYNMDALEFMKQETRYRRNLKIFMYIDPPYYAKGKSLYRYYYSDDDHKILASFIKNKVFPWLISYDAAPFIEKLYKKNNKISIYLDYSAKTSKKGAELLISNLEIPPLANAQLELAIN